MVIEPYRGFHSDVASLETSFPTLFSVQAIVKQQAYRYSDIFQKYRNNFKCFADVSPVIVLRGLLAAALITILPPLKHLSHRF